MDYKDRVRIEYDELSAKTAKLASFMNGEIYARLGAEEKQDLQDQLTLMRAYLALLTRRIKRLNG
jgi:hypothetical protein